MEVPAYIQVVRWVPGGDEAMAAQTFRWVLGGDEAMAARTFRWVLGGDQAMSRGDLHHANDNELIDRSPPCSYEALGSTFTYRTLGLSRPLASWRLTDFFGASAVRTGAVTQVSVARAGGDWQRQRRGGNAGGVVQRGSFTWEEALEA